MKHLCKQVKLVAKITYMRRIVDGRNCRGYSYFRYFASDASKSFYLCDVL